MERERVAAISTITQELRAFGEKHGLRGLDGRIQRGLDPAGMLAVKETSRKVETVADALGASMEDVIRLTNELHVGAIWSNADALAKGERPDVKVWMAMGEATLQGKEQEGDLDEGGFIEDLAKVNKLLDEAADDPDGFVKKSVEHRVRAAQDDFELEEGVPFSSADGAFLSAAITGHKAAVVEDSDGLFFVGANELDYGSLEAAGLTSIVKEDRGRENTFFQDFEGNDVVKKLYDGFAIVLNGDRDVAKSLAKTGIALAESGE